MFIRLPADLMAQADLDTLVRSACAMLSGRGVDNYLHYTRPRRVELYNPPRHCGVLIDFANVGIHLYSLPT